MGRKVDPQQGLAGFPCVDHAAADEIRRRAGHGEQGRGD